MAGVDVGVKGGLITGGLGRPGCNGMITMAPFHLACFVRKRKGVSGGVIPLEPGEIQDFYQPIDPETFGKTESEGEFVDPKVYGKQKVLIKVTSEYFKGEKEFLVNEGRAKFIIKVVSFANTTISKMSIRVSNIKQIATRATITIKNMKWKRKS